MNGADASRKVYGIGNKWRAARAVLRSRHVTRDHGEKERRTKEERRPREKKEDKQREQTKCGETRWHVLASTAMYVYRFSSAAREYAEQLLKRSEKGAKRARADERGEKEQLPSADRQVAAKTTTTVAAEAGRKRGRHARSALLLVALEANTPLKSLARTEHHSLTRDTTKHPYPSGSRSVRRAHSRASVIRGSRTKRCNDRRRTRGEDRDENDARRGRANPDTTRETAPTRRIYSQVSARRQAPGTGEEPDERSRSRRGAVPRTERSVQPLGTAHTDGSTSVLASVARSVTADTIRRLYLRLVRHVQPLACPPAYIPAYLCLTISLRSSPLLIPPHL